MSHLEFFAPDPESVVCSKEKVLKKLQLSLPYCKSFADSWPVFIEFCKFYGQFL